MHKICIPEGALQVVAARRGGAPVFPDLAGSKTALVVIDLQNAFMLPGMPMELPHARDIVGNVNRLAAATRDAGGCVIWVRINFAGQRESWSVWFERLMSPQVSESMIAALSPGDPGFELHRALDVHAEDVVLDKTRFSAFAPGSSEIETVLRARGIDTLVIAGALTNTCCESTARDAMMRNYRVLVVADANATRSDEEHNAALANVARVFGEVVMTDDVVKRLAASRPPG